MRVNFHSPNTSHIAYCASCDVFIFILITTSNGVCTTTTVYSIIIYKLIDYIYISCCKSYYILVAYIILYLYEPLQSDYVSIIF